MAEYVVVYRCRQDVIDMDMYAVNGVQASHKLCMAKKFGSRGDAEKFAIANPLYGVFNLPAQVIMVLRQDTDLEVPAEPKKPPKSKLTPVRVSWPPKEQSQAEPEKPPVTAKSIEDAATTAAFSCLAGRVAVLEARLKATNDWADTAEHHLNALSAWRDGVEDSLHEHSAALSEANRRLGDIAIAAYGRDPCDSPCKCS